jgi:hypothetical protein
MVPETQYFISLRLLNFNNTKNDKKISKGLKFLLVLILYGIILNRHSPVHFRYYNFVNSSNKCNEEEIIALYLKLKKCNHRDVITYNSAVKQRKARISTQVVPS